MRIGITCYPTYGGSGAVATELGLELARRGHDIHFISYASPFRLRGFAERVTFHEVTQLEYPLFEQSSPYALALAVKQHEVAKREQLDLMHVHYAIPHAATAWLAKQMLLHEKLDMKIVTTLHGTDITLVGQDPSYYTLTKFSIEQSDRVTAVSAFLRDETYRPFGCAGCDVIVIPNFISTAEYHPPREGTCRHSLAPPDHKVLVHVSNFRPVKRVTDVVRVFAGVRRASGDARAGGRRAGARRGGAGGRSPRATTRRPLPRQGGQRRRDPARQRPVPAAVRDRIVRPRRARGDGMRRTGHRDRRGRPPRGGGARGDGIPHAQGGRRGHDRARPSRAARWCPPRPDARRRRPPRARVRGRPHRAALRAAVRGRAA